MAAIHVSRQTAAWLLKLIRILHDSVWDVDFSEMEYIHKKAALRAV